MLPVFMAAGNVDALLLKYAPYGQPRSHMLRDWQTPREGSCASGAVKCATRPIVSFLPNFSDSLSRKTSSTQFNSIGGRNLPSGKCGIPSVWPLTPIYDST